MPDDTGKPVPARHLLAVFSALSLGLLAACGTAASTTSAKGPAVASLASTTGASGTAAPSASPSAERPLIRRDTSPAEQQRLHLAYATCLKAHGAVIANMEKYQLDPNKPTDMAAKAACASLEPEDYLDRLARTDPHYADYQRAWIECMKSKGLKVSAQGTMFQIDDDSQAAAGGTAKIIDDCEAVAFAGK